MGTISLPPGSITTGGNDFPAGTPADYLSYDSDGNLIAAPFSAIAVPVGISSDSATPALSVSNTVGSGISIVSELAILGQNTTANNATSVFRTGCRHYNTSEEPLCVYTATSGAAVSTIDIGGGASSLNACTDINFYTAANTTTAVGTNRATISADGTFTLRFNVAMDKTITPAGTTGAQTINKNLGSVNFAALAASVVVTDSRVTANSVVMLQVRTVDATMISAVASVAAGSFTITPNAAPTGEVRVDFLILN